MQGMRIDTYDQALAFWYSRINYEQRTPQPSDLKLDRMRALLSRLGEPQDRLRIVHVAGSKGKGSTSAMLAAILRQAGYRIGLFTSPHLCRVEERIQVDGTPISGEELIALMQDVQPVVEALDAAAPTPGGRPTFFEVATALGFLHFIRRRTDLAVVEVGLGGRFDSTNVCRPTVAVITSISLDHTQQLGDCLSSIAREKAGIVKPGRPVVSGATGAEARAVIESICGERAAPLRQLGVDFHYWYQPGLITAELEQAPRVQVSTALPSISLSRQMWPALELGLLGEHQAANAAVTIACVEELRAQGLIVPDAAVAAGLAEVNWPARLEVLNRRPFVVLDCAHNVASVQALVDTLRTSFPATRRLLVFAASNDKDLPGMLHVLTPHFSQVFLTRFDNSRCADPNQLADLLRASGNAVTVQPAAPLAWQAARSAAGPNDLVCIAGSVFLAGELRPLLIGQGKANP